MRSLCLIKEHQTLKQAYSTTAKVVLLRCTLDITLVIQYRVCDIQLAFVFSLRCRCWFIRRGTEYSILFYHLSIGNIIMMF